MIFVTKSFLPPRETFNKYIDKIYANHWLTNFGSLEQLLTQKLQEFLEVENLLLTSNGTLAMQVAYRALGITGEVITTPFSFVATTSSLVWEKYTPIFADINPTSLNIDPISVSKKITAKTSAILPVHVFGRPCDVHELQKIADQNRLKIIYDAAHAFNVKLNTGENVLNYGDISTLSFHATKLFHTIEGGAVTSKDPNLIKECKKLINFGITGYDKIESLGINGKMNEFAAAMGLAVLENIEEIIMERQRVFETYNSLLDKSILPEQSRLANSNYSYYPILLPNEDVLIKVRDDLLNHDIMARRYFYPSLNTLNYIKYESCPIAEDITKRILCLPMSPSLNKTEIIKISNLVNRNMNN